MKKQIIMSILVALIAFLSSGSIKLWTGTVNAQEDAVEGQYASVNGLELYYEVYGEGDPLILLHGGLGGIVEFAGLIPQLATSRQVIAVELQGHGHTADIDRSITYEALADDIAELIEYLGFENADVAGYSLGGGVALQTAIRHPEAVRKLILISTPFRRDGIHAEFLAGMSAMSAEAASAMLETPMYQFYASAAPNLDNWATLVGKVGELLATDYDWSEGVDTLTVPTLILVGDSDMLSVSHAVEMFELLGGGVAGGMVAEMPTSQLAVLPGTIHFTILYNPELATLIPAFLDTPAAQ